MTLIELANKQNKAILITGKEASGKLTLARQFAEHDGPYAEISCEQLSWRFNNWMNKKICTVIINGEPDDIQLSIIKKLVTSKIILVERKGHNSIKYRAPNIILCSQSRLTTTKSNDRRFLIVKLG